MHWGLFGDDAGTKEGEGIVWQSRWEGNMEEKKRWNNQCAVYPFPQAALRGWWVSVWLCFFQAEETVGT